MIRPTDRARVRHVSAAWRRCRELRRIPQERLGLMCGVARTHVGRIERAENNPTMLSMCRILVALGVTWAEFGAVLDEEIARQPTRPTRHR